jgi:filamentous hemagglutinin
MRQPAFALLLASLLGSFFPVAADPNSPASQASQPPKILVSRAKYPEVAQHIEDAQRAGKPRILTIDRPGADQRRKEALRGIPKVPGKQLDEYPPAMFKEGGTGAHVRPVDPSQNQGAGAWIASECRKYPDGFQVEILVGP